jgi:uroporphyrinogen-III synthase
LTRKTPTQPTPIPWKNGCDRNIRIVVVGAGFKPALSTHSLEEKVEEAQWPEELVKTIKGFQKEEKQVFVKLRKRKDVDEEG